VAKAEERGQRQVDKKEDELRRMKMGGFGRKWERDESD
jgi:hypothetical protein